MANDLVNIKEDAAPTKKLASQSFTRGADTVHQEEVVIGDGTTNGRLLGITAANEAKVLSSAQPGVDIGDVTINNAAAGAAVNIQDGGNSITVDGTVTTTPPANASTNVAQFGGTNTVTGVGAAGAGIPRVTISNDSSLAANQSVNLNQVGAAAITEGQKTMAASIPVVIASDQTTLPAVSENRASTLHVTGTAAVNTALTITLPAAGAGLFHYITSIQWVKLYSIVGVANGAGVLITSTNLPGNPIWTTEQAAGAAGTAPVVINYQPTTPLKSSVANTATTIVAPLQLQTIWRGNVSYFTGV